MVTRPSVRLFEETASTWEDCSLQATTESCALAPETYTTRVHIVSSPTETKNLNECGGGGDDDIIFCEKWQPQCRRGAAVVVVGVAAALL